MDHPFFQQNPYGFHDPPIVSSLKLLRNFGARTWRPNALIEWRWMDASCMRLVVSHWVWGLCNASSKSLIRWSSKPIRLYYDNLCPKLKKMRWNFRPLFSVCIPLGPRLEADPGSPWCSLLMLSSEASVQRFQVFCHLNCSLNINHAAYIQAHLEPGIGYTPQTVPKRVLLNNFIRFMRKKTAICSGSKRYHCK